MAVQAEDVQILERIRKADRSAVLMIFMGICSEMKGREFGR
jgi:hypothetical protein